MTSTFSGRPIWLRSACPAIIANLNRLKARHARGYFMLGCASQERGMGPRGLVDIDVCNGAHCQIQPNRSAGLGRTRLCHPWGREPEGGVVGRLRSVSHVVRHRQGSGFDGLGWVPLGPKRARQGPVWSRMGPYISRTPIRDSRVIRRGSSGPVGPYRVPTGFRRNPVLARRDPTGLDGSLDCPVSVHD